MGELGLGDRAVDDLAHDLLDRADRELREAAEVAGEGQRLGLEVGGREKLRGEAEAERLLGVEHGRAHQHLLGLGGADEVDQALGLVERIGQAEAGGRDAEARRGVGVAQVAAQRERAAAAEADALDQRDRRFSKPDSAA